MTLLIANVGGRDLECTLLSKRNRSEREWAAEVAARYEELRHGLRLPIIGKALRHLAATGVTLEALVLVASDQPMPPVGSAEQRFWLSDTGPTAQLMVRLLAEGSGELPPLPAERTLVWTIATPDGQGADPSDYDVALSYLERRLRQLAADYPTPPALLEVAGGTPAMTTALLIAGVEAFGARAEALAIHPAREVPAALGVGRRLLAAPLRAALYSNAATFAYDAALRTLHAERDAIGDRLAPGALEAAEALLSYACARYNFDFPGARAALLPLLDVEQPWRQEFASLVAQVTNPDRSALLAEVVHGAEARYTTGLYVDFLTQLVRFEENLLRKLCLDRGVRFVRREDGSDDAEGSLISREWLRAQPFTLKGDYDDGRDRTNSRGLMRDILGLLTKSCGEDLQVVVEMIDRLRPLVYLRNETTHSLEGLRKLDLARRFSAYRTASEQEADQIVPYLATLYAKVADRPLPPSPYPVINGLLGRLLQGGVS